MDLMLTDKVTLLSGGSRGIGFQIAKDLVSEGSHVVISARGEDQLMQAVDEINGQKKGRAVGFVGDVTRKGIPEAFVRKALDSFGGVDVLINSVGAGNPKVLLNSTDEDWQQSFELNLFTAVRLSRLIVPEMKKRGGGAILNIASIWGRESKGTMIYNATKASLISFSKALAQQVAKENIRVNSLAPGSIWFPGGVWDRRVKEAPDGLRGFINSELPFGRFGRPEEVSALALFMVSPRASLVHGACWNIDGGQSRSNI